MATEKKYPYYTGIIDVLGSEIIEFEPSIPDNEPEGFIRLVSPKMQNGGEIKDQYIHKTPSEVWSLWDRPQRLHFLMDHTDDIIQDAKSEGKEIEDIKKYVAYDYFQLPKAIQENIYFHITMGQYEGGGKLTLKQRNTRKEHGATITNKKGKGNLVGSRIQLKNVPELTGRAGFFKGDEYYVKFDNGSDGMFSKDDLIKVK